MNYHLIWTPKALNDLTNLWLRTPHRERLTRLIPAVEKHLSQDPEGYGTCQFDTVYTVVTAIMGMEYEVIPDDRHVHILRVWDPAQGFPEPSDN